MAPRALTPLGRSQRESAREEAGEKALSSPSLSELCRALTRRGASPRVVQNIYTVKYPPAFEFIYVVYFGFS